MTECGILVLNGNVLKVSPLFCNKCAHTYRSTAFDNNPLLDLKSEDSFSMKHFKKENEKIKAKKS